MFFLRAVSVVILGLLSALNSYGRTLTWDPVNAAQNRDFSHGPNWIDTFTQVRQVNPPTDVDAVNFDNTELADCIIRNEAKVQSISISDQYSGKIQLEDPTGTNTSTNFYIGKAGVNSTSNLQGGFIAAEHDSKIIIDGTGDVRFLGTPITIENEVGEVGWPHMLVQGSVTLHINDPSPTSLEIETEMRSSSKMYINPTSGGVDFNGRLLTLTQNAHMRVFLGSYLLIPMAIDAGLIHLKDGGKMTVEPSNGDVGIGSEIWSDGANSALQIATGVTNVAYFQQDIKAKNLGMVEILSGTFVIDEFQKLYLDKDGVLYINGAGGLGMGKLESGNFAQNDVPTIEFKQSTLPGVLTSRQFFWEGEVDLESAKVKMNQYFLPDSAINDYFQIVGDLNLGQAVDFYYYHVGGMTDEEPEAVFFDVFGTRTGNFFTYWRNEIHFLDDTHTYGWTITPLSGEYFWTKVKPIN